MLIKTLNQNPIPQLIKTNKKNNNIQSSVLTSDSVSFCASPNHAKAKKIWSAFDRSRSIAILTHKDPDPDAISSGLLLLELLQNKYKNKCIKFVVNSNIAKVCSRIPNINQISKPQDLSFKNFDTVVVLDCDERQVDCKNIFNKSAQKINIDHHYQQGRGKNFTPELTIIETKAVSTTQVIFDNLIYDFNLVPTDSMAECIMTGVLSDSGNFRYILDYIRKKFDGFMFRFKSVTPATVIELRHRVNNNFRRAIDYSKELKLLNYKLVKEKINTQEIETKNNVKLTSVIIDKDLLQSYGVKDDEADIKNSLNRLANYNRPESGISAILWQRKNGEIKISLRSHDYNLIPIVEKLNGGGHKLAAGASLKGSPKEALKTLIKTIESIPDTSK